MRIAVMLFSKNTISKVGGRERIFTEMSNSLSSRGHEVLAVWNDKPRAVPFFPLNRHVERLNLSLGRLRPSAGAAILQGLSRGLGVGSGMQAQDDMARTLANEFLRNHAVRDVEVFVCFDYMSVLMARRLGNGKIPIVWRIGSVPGEELSKLNRAELKAAATADACVVMQEPFIEHAKKYLGENARIEAIPNPVPLVPESSRADFYARKTVRRIVHIGRLEGHRKRQMLLVRAFQPLAKTYPSWEVRMYGPVADSDYQRSMASYLKKYHLQKQVRFCGVTGKISSVLRSADIFAFPSAWEGFSLAMTEAMGAGLPVLAFKGAPGVSTLIEHGVNGLLAKDETDFQGHLQRLIRNRRLRIKLGGNARMSMEKYSPDIVWPAWESLLRDVVWRRK